MVPLDVPIRTAASLQNRIAYYGRRQTLPPEASDWRQTPYILLERTSLTEMDEDVPLPRELLLEGVPTRIVAEIGPYVLGKQSGNNPGTETRESRTAPVLDRRATFWQSP